MKNKKIFMLGISLLIGIVLVSLVSSQSYIYSNPNHGLFDSFITDSSPLLDREACEAGQDFIVQIAPFGCEPAVVRSDLLEEQNVPVFCQLAATKINPLIDVKAIESITFSGQYPREVSGIGFHPANAALGVRGDINSPLLENIGYVVVVIKEQKNESLMPDYVEGNLTARLRYDIQNAFGIGQATFYLPALTDEQWEENMKQYGFWDGRGYVRAEGIAENTAKIAIYNDIKRISGVTLEKGKTSNKISIPGFDECLAKMQLRLDGIVNPDTRAKFDINGDIYEVAKGENFLDNKCFVRNIEKNGLNQKVTLNCREDDDAGFFGSNDFDLIVSPRVTLEIEGVGKKEVSVGDYLYDSDGGNKRVYLGFLGTDKNTGQEKDLYAYLVAIPSAQISQDKLDNAEISSMARYDKEWMSKSDVKSIGDFGNWLGNKIAGTARNVGKWVIDGKNIGIISYSKGETDILGKKVEIIGFAGAQDFGTATVEQTYTLKLDGKDWKVIDSKGTDTQLTLKSDGDLYKLYRGSKLIGQFTEIGQTKKYFLTSSKEGFSDAFFENLVDGSAILNLGSEQTISLKRKVAFEGTLKDYYDSAKKDYKDVIDSFGSVPTENEKVSYGEAALVGEILLANSLNQKGTVKTLCEEFKGKYSDSTYSKASSVLELCSDLSKLSSSSVASRDVVLNGDVKRISFENIVEPSEAEYSAVIQITGTDGRVNEVILGKDEVVYLDEFRDPQHRIYTYFDSGSFPLFITFINTKWYWSADQKNWVETSITTIPKASEAQFGSLFNGYSILTGYMTAKKKAVIEKLAGYNNAFNAGKSYLDGLGAKGADTNEFIRLTGLDENSAQLSVNLIPNSGWQNVKSFLVTTTSGTLKKDDPNSLGSDFIFTLRDVNLQKVAKVSVIPNIDNAYTTANFSFKIGIEKRAIQLSPEKTREKIKNLDETIAKWDKISGNLGNVVQGLKGACLATGAFLTVKNFVQGWDGKAIARTEVMTGTGGWNERCADMVTKSEKGYKNLNECLTKEADNIDKEVEQYYNTLKTQNEQIKQLQTSLGCENNEFLTERQIDTNCFMNGYSAQVKNELANCQREIDLGGSEGKKSCAEIIKIINENTTTVEQLRELQLKYRLDPTSKGVNSILKDISVNNKDFAEKQSFIEEINKKQGLIGVGFDYGRDKDAQEKIYEGGKSGGSGFRGIPADSYVKGFGYGGTKYLLELNKDKDKDYSVANVYNLEGIKVDNSGELAKEINKKFSFKEYDLTTYKNPYKSSISDPKNPVVRYFETAPYAKMPAIVPFELNEGWYAGAKQAFGVNFLSTEMASYDKSGAPRNYYICNVGQNGKEENFGGDDICRMINVGTGQSYDFPGLDKSKQLKIVRCAEDALGDAAKAYGKGSSVRISTGCGSFSVKVGNPAVDVPEMQCQNFMSPKDCKWLFNLCDPVICPPSRCNFGGTYPVRDVVQSGIIGSIALCFPNFVGFGGDVYVPVCLTGIKAGIDGWLSIIKSHRDCLQESLDTGQMVGICDEVYSIYACEFFWRQALPLAKITLPKVLEVMLGQNVRGGGEYMGVASAWQNAENSVSYFTQYYAKNSFEAFKARTAEEVGGEICKVFTSGVYPSGGNLLGSLTEPDSPPQFHGRFDEIPFTTATVPPVSQYKVFYHIYAGEDSRAFYQVYLTEGAESSFYQDTSMRRIVASGYISKGDSASETVDFTAPSGYKKLCIRVNEFEECGFKQASTSFAVNYVNDQYMKEIGQETNIQNERECVAGTVSAYSLLNPNLQSGVTETVSPEIYNRGIIRVCSTANPGLGTDAKANGQDSRWVQVGQCSADGNIKCWLDTASVKEVIKDTAIENETLQTQYERTKKLLEAEGKLLNNAEIEQKIKEIKSETDNQKKISLVNEIISKVFWNQHKAELLFLRGGAYGELAKSLYIAVKDKGMSDAGAIKPATTTETIASNDQSSSSSEDKTCQQIVGEEIIKIAREIKNEKNIDDSSIQKDTGAKDFECLVLQLAMQESSLQHCNEKKENDCLYCDGQKDEVLKSSGDEKSYGVMQINVDQHKGNFENFEENIKYGINYLVKNYDSSTVKNYACRNENYSGWKRALRFYNGWNTDCSKGNINYVEEVIGEEVKSNGKNTKGELIKIFPGCA